MNFRIAALAGAIVLGPSGVAAAQSAPPTPPPPATTATAAPAAAPSLPPTPAPSVTPAPRGRSKRESTPQPNASPTDTPAPPQFSTLDGVWEVALQPLNASRAIYSHLYITQNGANLSGTWRREDHKTVLPFTGTFDGRLFKITITDKTATYTMSGYAENFGDMVGLLVLDPTKDGTPFTASHRKKEKPGKL